MTAPRPTDEQFEKAAFTESPLRLQKLYREGLRARSAESAALARVRRLEEALAKMHSEAEDWIHTEDCSRTNDCDLAAPCGGESEPCPAAAPHVWCDYHGHETCPDCECGKAPLLKMLRAALSEET